MLHPNVLSVEMGVQWIAPWRDVDERVRGFLWIGFMVCMPENHRGFGIILVVLACCDFKQLFAICCLVGGI